MAEKIRLLDKQVVDFGDCLYNGVCKECGSHIQWEANFDADGTNYFASCCDLNYAMFPNTVIVTVSTIEEEN